MLWENKKNYNKNLQNQLLQEGTFIHFLTVSKMNTNEATKTYTYSGFKIWNIFTMQWRERWEKHWSWAAVSVLWEENREWCELVQVAALVLLLLPVTGGGGAGWGQTRSLCFSQHRREVQRVAFSFPIQVDRSPWPLLLLFLSLSFGRIAWDLHLSFCKGLKALYLQVTMLLQKLLPVPVIYCIKRIYIVLTLEEPSSSSMESCIFLKCISLNV